MGTVGYDSTLVRLIPPPPKSSQPNNANHMSFHLRFFINTMRLARPTQRLPASIRIKIDLAWLSRCQKRARWPRREGERSGDDAFGIEPNWAATGAEVEVSPLSPQFVGGGFGGWYLPLSRSLTLSPTLKRQLE